MSIIRMLLSFALLAALVCWEPKAVAAQSYPSRPIKVIVPYPPGGNTDLCGRLFAQRLSELLDGSAVIDNRARGSAAG